uniref:Phosphoglycerate mutase family protein n=1 Tax=Macrostomum lignano TaxID=282301 RepID=A0A1I8FD24_9PLAT
TPSGVPPRTRRGSSDSMPPSPKPVGKSKSLDVVFLVRTGRAASCTVIAPRERACDTTVRLPLVQQGFDSKAYSPIVEDFDRDTRSNADWPVRVAQMGEALARAGVRYTYATAAAALRCVQTAHHLLQGAGPVQAVCTDEPMLNEFPHDHDDQAQMPRFMSPTELRSGNILVVGHRTTIEFCPIILMGYKSYVKRVCIPYNAMLCLDERPKKGTWVLANQPSAAFSCNEHCRFDGSMVVAVARIRACAKMARIREFCDHGAKNADG